MDTKQGRALRSSEMWHKWPSRRKTRGKREILPKHMRLPGICETVGLGLILHFKLETGKCGHDSTFKSAPPLSQQAVWALFEKKRGKNYKSGFPRGMAVSSTGFEKKQPDPSGERMEEHRELHLSGSDWACFCVAVIGGLQARQGWRSSLKLAWAPAGTR